MNSIFDAGVFLAMFIVGFIPLFIASRLGALCLIISILAFLFCGLVLFTGDDIAFIDSKIPPTITINGTVSNVPSCTSTVCNTVTETSKTTQTFGPESHIIYILGNGSNPNGLNQLLFGSMMFGLCALSSILFLDMMMKGELLPVKSSKSNSN